uniref:Uncharacterized protein n=1 Tax=Anopheles culicifacies TaxID=139723 RepID=A0A182MK41_9DIPT
MEVLARLRPLILLRLPPIVHLPSTCGNKSYLSQACYVLAKDTISFSFHRKPPFASDTPVKANFTYVQLAKLFANGSTPTCTLPPGELTPAESAQWLSGFPDRKQSLLRYDAVVVVVVLTAKGTWLMCVNGKQLDVPGRHGHGNRDATRNRCTN